MNAPFIRTVSPAAKVRELTNETLLAQAQSARAAPDRYAKSYQRALVAEVARRKL